jgi:hypothetical protein
MSLPSFSFAPQVGTSSHPMSSIQEGPPYKGLFPQLTIVPSCLPSSIFTPSQPLSPHSPEAPAAAFETPRKTQWGSHRYSVHGRTQSTPSSPLQPTLRPSFYLNVTQPDSHSPSYSPSRALSYQFKAHQENIGEQACDLVTLDQIKKIYPQAHLKFTEQYGELQSISSILPSQLEKQTQELYYDVCPASNLNPLLFKVSVCEKVSKLAQDHFVIFTNRRPGLESNSASTGFIIF